MILISHRGNTNGIIETLENTEDYIKSAIDKGFDVEIDVWLTNEGLFLGHDFPHTPVKLLFLESYNNKLWIHCKNINALSFLKDKFNCFFHDTDEAVLTSKNFIWTYTGKQLTNKSIAVLPEEKYTDKELANCLGICSDYVIKYK